MNGPIGACVSELMCEFAYTMENRPAKVGLFVLLSFLLSNKKKSIKFIRLVSARIHPWCVCVCVSGSCRPLPMCRSIFYVRYVCAYRRCVSLSASTACVLRVSVQAYTFAGAAVAAAVGRWLEIAFLVAIFVLAAALAYAAKRHGCVRCEQHKNHFTINYVYLLL